MKDSFTKKFGFLFVETLQKGKKRKAPTSELLKKAVDWGAADPFASTARFGVSSWRLVPVYFLLAAGGILLVSRLFDLQVIQGSAFRGKASGNHLAVAVDHAPRGVIFDRNGVVLAQNIPGYRLVVDKISFKKSPEILKKLSEISGLPATEIEKRIENSEDTTAAINNNLSAEKALVFESQGEQLAGVSLEINPIRYYPYRETTAHILGYTTEADEKDLGRKLPVPYSLGDRVGKAGVEAAFEENLRGVNGYTLVGVNAAGEKTGQAYQTDSKAGQNVTLSIDSKLQTFVYQTLEKKIREAKAVAGSAVVLDAKTGEVLSLVSIPSYDNNLFSQGLTNEDYNHLISNPDKLLLNRAVGAGYPSGSTFKLITATAGLETGTINQDTKIVDTGFISLGGFIFNNWLWLESRRTEGAINVIRAMVRSTDTFFYELGRRVGQETLIRFAKMFGIGEKTGVELPDEIAGLLPTPEWKKKARGEPWYPGETLNLSIGQGDLLVTPLQLSRATTVFANGGRLATPTILKANSPKVERENFLKKETIETVAYSMNQVVMGAGGLSWVFGGLSVPSAGKTGTAESGKDRPHAWYTGFAPYPDGKIVATVQVEHAGHGSEVSAPVVREIFKWWFARR